jgi:hypothetical protein
MAGCRLRSAVEQKAAGEERASGSETVRLAGTGLELPSRIGEAAGMNEHMKHEGRCHCGAIRIQFESGKPFAPRACQCGFCRRHGARSVSDPDGAATLTLAAEPLRYRFASGSADYLICPRCGIYVGAMARIEGRDLVTLNLNAFDDPRPELAAAPVSYDGESAATKTERRRERWTPLTLAWTQAQLSPRPPLC